MSHSDGMEREACVCDHGLERSDLCAEIIIIIPPTVIGSVRAVALELPVLLLLTTH